MNTLSKNMLYLYCVTEHKPDLKNIIDLANELHYVYHKGLYSIVSKDKEGEFSDGNFRENLSNIEWINEKAITHEKIIEEIMKNSCLIPFKFATLYKTAASLKSYMEVAADELLEKLCDLKGKEEWGVKIYCNRQNLMDSLIHTDKELLKKDREISSSSPGRAFILKKQNEELLNAAVNERLNTFSQCSFDILKEQSLKAQINKLMPKEVTERQDDMILNSAFLVDKINVPTFVNTVTALKEKYKDTGILMDYTGPWPPYNFCNTSKEVS